MPTRVTARILAGLPDGSVHAWPRSSRYQPQDRGVCICLLTDLPRTQERARATRERWRNLCREQPQRPLRQPRHPHWPCPRGEMIRLPHFLSRADENRRMGEADERTSISCMGRRPSADINDQEPDSTWPACVEGAPRWPFVGFLLSKAKVF
jgi:hypothetical protein